VHDPGTVAHADIICQADIPGGLIDPDKSEERLIGPSFQRGTGKLLQDLIIAFQHFQTGFGQDELLFLKEYLHISFIRMHGQGDV